MYLESKLVHRDILAGNPVLTKWYKRATEEGIPDIAVSAMQGQYLSVLAKGLRAEKILEIGTLWGSVRSPPIVSIGNELVFLATRLTSSLPSFLITARSIHSNSHPSTQK